MNNSFFRIIAIFSGFLCVLLVCSWIGDYRSRETSPVQNTFTSKQADPVGNKNTDDTTGYTAKIKPAVIVKGTIKSGETFAHALERKELDRSLESQVIKGLSQVVDFRKCRPGDSFRISLNDCGVLIRCTYERGPLEIYALEPNEDSVSEFHAFRDSVLLECRLTKLSGIIDSSLFSAFSKIGANSRLTMAFTDIFASRLDFNTETRLGDQFDVIVEEYFKDDRFVGYGKIVAAQYKNHYKGFDAYYYRPEGQTKGKYYDPAGQEVGTSFLRSPLPVYRVTSKFSKRRLHPILKVYRPHLGVDLAAPIGTRIMAAADGRVSFVGWQKGFGRIVILKHPGGYKTYYGHLSRFAKGIKKGIRVEQKQIIGYVGSSGLSTGPHLDYRIKENGVFKNPFNMKFKPKSRLSGKALDDYIKEQGEWGQLLENNSAPKTLQIETRKIRKQPDGWLG
ncbi:MAG TPA: M23 family metallopeptidase [Deltaproteobacteria bacterium]|nr:M23 family metallopeptidase [Deltaproteobacteria bacterium]